VVEGTTNVVSDDIAEPDVRTHMTAASGDSADTTVISTVHRDTAVAKFCRRDLAERQVGGQHHRIPAHVKFIVWFVKAALRGRLKLLIVLQ
jgi:hypothetical protein